MKTLAKIMLIFCGLSVFVCIIMCTKILKGIAKKQKKETIVSCNYYTISLTLSIISRFSATFIEELARFSIHSSSIIFAKSLWEVLPLIIGGGSALYLFKKAAKNF